MTQTIDHSTRDNEARRLAELDGYHVLDTEPEPGLDALVRYAQRIFGASIAVISLVAEDRQFFMARRGIEATEMPREGSFCTHTVLGHEVLVVPDATCDERFCRSPLVTGAPHIRFYAGTPLLTPNGFAIGAFCIQDVVPRPQGLSEDEQELLVNLATLVMDKLEIRRLSTIEADARKRFEAVAGSSADSIICADEHNRILSWNKAAERMFGYEARDVIGRNLNIIIPPQFRAMHQAGLQRAAAGLETKLVGSLVTVPALKRSLEEFPIELSLSHWVEGGEHRFGAIARDITQRLATEARLKYAAEYDAMTGLANRTFLDADLATTSGAGLSVALILIDLDGFKDVNDSLGHAAGDEVLKAVAKRLADVATGLGLPCRLGGDEFVVVMRNVDDPSTALRMADRLIKAIERPVELGERSIYVGASAGVSFASGAAWPIDALFEQADLALYKAKTDGKGRARAFTRDLQAIAQTRTSISSGIRQAWERGELALYYQPQVRLSDACVVGAEALIRWNHPERGLLTPAAFLSTLETSLLAIPVSEWILETACRQAAAWRASKHPTFRIGVNLFAAQLRSGELPGVVQRVLRETGLCASALELEITENTILCNEARIHAALQALRDIGIGIAFDDYGTGFASLTMLKNFPVTRLKIDRSFVSGPDTGARDLVIVEAIARLAQGLELEVIAEGIETQAQADLMRAHCREGQGYFFGRPMTAGAFEKTFLDDGRCRPGSGTAS